MKSINPFAVNCAVTLLLLGYLVPASAVEAPKPVISLFDEDLMTNLAGIDFVGNAGIEALGGNQSLVILPASDPAKVKSRVKFNIRAKNSANNSTLGTVSSFVTTRAYPDPDTAVATNYFCEGDEFFRGVDPTIENFPCDLDINVGIANSGATRYLVVSLAVFVSYENAMDGEVVVGKAAITVWNRVSLMQLWRKEWNVESGPWELENDGLSAVGDFLNADGTDEVRIVHSRGASNDRVEMMYTYYDIATGNEIKEDRFYVPSP